MSSGCWRPAQAMSSALAGANGPVSAACPWALFPALPTPLSSQVRTYNVLLKTWGNNYTHHKMTHPAGLTKHDDVLYVLCQDQR